MSPEATWFLPLRALGIRVGHSHYDVRENQRFMTGICIMLECALGEFAFAEKLQHVEVMLPPSVAESSGYLPPTGLAAMVDEVYALDRLAGYEELLGLHRA